MTPLLLDTHVVLWVISGDKKRIPSGVASLLEDQETDVLLSAVVIWEIAVKRSIGKLDAEDGWLRAIGQLGFNALPVSAAHAAATESLPWHHRDPFDRLLVAQATVEGAALVTADSRIAAYDVPILWRNES